MDNNGRYILVGQSVVACDDLLEWASWFESFENRRVKLTKVGPYNVSTVFLGLDHSYPAQRNAPIVFETMVWVDNPHTLPAIPEYGIKERLAEREFLEIQERCSTWQEAEKQHQEVIDRIKEPGDVTEEVEFSQIES